jgi:hypothetical protein
LSTIGSLTHLPPSVARHTLYVLTGALPAPLTDIPEECAARDAAAIAALGDLHPEDAFRARLAARAVAADAHAMECLRLAGLPGQEPDEARRCRAQASAMMRAAQSALTALRAVQAPRAKADATVIAAASKRTPDRPPAPADIATEADQYALRHRKRAALIRRLGRLPDHVDCGPMPPELLAAIVSGDSPILQALDARPRSAVATAA